MPLIKFFLGTFLSTLSLRRATLRVVDGSKSSIISIHALLAESDFRQNYECFEWIKFLSTLSLRRATRRSVKLFRQNYISIHALLAESDGPPFAMLSNGRISIHALLAESDIGPLIFSVQPRNFYPRSPCGERPLYNCGNSCTQEISIHALLAESDQRGSADDMCRYKFLSTLSLRRATPDPSRE